MAKSRVPVAVGAATATETPNVSSIPITPAAGEEPDSDQPAIVIAADEDGRAPRFRGAIPIVLGLSALGVVAMFAVGLLDENPDIKAEWFENPRWLSLYGLPVAYEDRGGDGS